MTGNLLHDLGFAIRSGRTLQEIVSLLRAYKAQGVARDEVYALLTSMRLSAQEINSV